MIKLIFAICYLLFSLTTQAELSLLNQEVLTDSEEPFSRRIYAYDFDVSAAGVVHAVYAKPVPGEARAKIIYTTKRVGENWPHESSHVVLEENGLLASISIGIIYSNTSETAHIYYIVNGPFVDSLGESHANGLVYQTITDGKTTKKNNVSPGGFNTMMQLNVNDAPIFIREYEVFLNAEGKLNTPPFPKALRLQLPFLDNTWSDREYLLNLPYEEDYRLANFIYDKINNRYHVSYGNKSADRLRALYPTVNPPINPDNKPVFFPPGSGHQLLYAFSDDLINWQVSTIDGSGNISENEFWTDLILSDLGKPYAANYRYKTDVNGVHEGTSVVFSSYEDGDWHVHTVDGKTTGASESRAGMGPKILQDSIGGFHGVWDNSPDTPIDSESGAGSTMYRYSPTGIDWETRQVILPFSVEGKCRAKIFDNKLLLMLLGDATDAKVVFAEYKIPAPAEPLMEISSDKMFYGAGEVVRLHARLQGAAQNVDLNLLIMGPYDKDSDGNFILTSMTENYYLGPDFNWHRVIDTLGTKPALNNHSLGSFNSFFIEAITQSELPPFNKPGRYLFYSVASHAGSNLSDLQFVTPLYNYEIHVCNMAGCAEIRK